MYGAFDWMEAKSTSMMPSQHTFNKKEFGENLPVERSSRAKETTYTRGGKGNDEQEKLA